MQMANQNQQPTPITQNFQLAPNQTNNGIKYVTSIDDVKQELTFTDTIFVNKEFSNMWVKNASGEIRTYKLKEIIKKDEKDLKIEELEAKIDKLIKEREHEQNERYLETIINQNKEIISLLKGGNQHES